MQRGRKLVSVLSSPSVATLPPKQQLAAEFSRLRQRLDRVEELIKQLPDDFIDAA